MVVQSRASTAAYVQDMGPTAAWRQCEGAHAPCIEPGGLNQLASSHQETAALSSDACARQAVAVFEHQSWNCIKVRSPALPILRPRASSVERGRVMDAIALPILPDGEPGSATRSTHRVSLAARYSSRARDLGRHRLRVGKLCTKSTIGKYNSQD
eukprot:365440-Chlamydomonas_euryale.AAC.4